MAWKRVLAPLASVAVCLVPLCGGHASAAAARPAGAAVAGGWIPAQAISGLGFLGGNSDTPPVPLACASPGNCVVVGNATGATGGGVFATETDGAWGAAQAIPGLAALSTAAPGQPDHVACGAPGDCAVSGIYYLPQGDGMVQLAFVASETDGVWGDAIPVPGLEALDTERQDAASSLSCPSAGNCTAVGFYTTSSGVMGAWVASEAAGVWGNAQEGPGLSGITGLTRADLLAVSCWSAGNCEAGGSYRASSGGGTYVADETNGAWTEDPASGAAGTVEDVACVPPGTCQRAVDNDSQIYSMHIACWSAGNCVQAVTLNSSQVQVSTEADGTWQPAEQMPGTSSGGTFANALSCGPDGTCGAGGLFNYTATPTGEAMLTIAQDGAWGSAQQVPGIVNTYTQVLGTSCVAGYCAVAGILQGTGTAANEPFVASDTVCQRATLTDASYEFGGCFAEQDAGTLDVTTQRSNLDGVVVSASPADQVSYDDGGANGHALVSSGAATLSLNLGGSLIPVFTGTLDDQLTGPIGVNLPGSAAAARAGPAGKAPPDVRGVPISGKLTISPDSGGKAAGAATAVLPAVLGGGTAKLTFTTTVNKGLSNVKVTATRASFLQLFSLSDLVLTYKAGRAGTGTWKVSATVSSAGKAATPFSGTLAYKGNTLTSAALSMGAVSLAGLIDLTRLSVSYDTKTGWAGNLTISPADSGDPQTVSFSLRYTTAGLASATLTGKNIELFGVLNVTSFTLNYAPGSWDLSIATPGGGGGSASLTVTGGEVTGASLTLTKLSFLGKFGVDRAAISYAATAPNPGCPKVTGVQIWCGDWQIQLPQASVVKGVSGALAISGGEFASGSVVVAGNVPLIDGIVLTKLGGSVTVNPPPTTISGTAAFTFGPTIKGKPLASFDGKLTRTLPAGDTSGSYTAHGDLNILSKLRGTIDITVPGNRDPVTIDLAAKIALAGAAANGDLTGTFTASKFTLTGDVNIRIGTARLSGKLVANNHGMAACGSYHGHQAGFEYVWDTGIRFLGDRDCRETGF